MAGDISGWVAAAAAIVAAGVVTWQSWETRKSAEASQDAVRTANAALELSRQQAAESVRARIDAATPTITVQLAREPTWPPLEPSGFSGGEPQPLTTSFMSAPMHMPRDRTRLILIRTPVTIINESRIHVVVEVNELIDDKGARVATSVRLEPGEEFTAWFAVTRSLEDWITVYRAREAGEPGEERSGSVVFLDPTDTGVVDRWDLTFGGTPIEAVPELEGAWRLIPEPRGLSGQPGAIGLGSVLRQRHYYLSKSRNERLPD